MSSIYPILRINRFIKSQRVKLFLIFVAQLVHKRYYSVRIDPIYACNLRCKMCYFSGERKPNGKQFAPTEIDHISKALFRGALQVVIGCGAEPTMAKNYLRIATKAKQYGVPNISLVTNGQLITPEQLNTIANSGIDELIISTHGTSKSTYEFFMQGAKWENLIDLLNNYSHINGKKPSLRINYTANPENIDELENFFEIFGGYDINTLQVRPIMNIGGEFKHGFNSNNIEHYNRVLLKLKENCKYRKVQLLANIKNPSYTTGNRPNPIINETYLYISPIENISEDFNWVIEDYRAFQKRTKWRKVIIQKIFTRNWNTTANNFSEKFSGQYDIM